MATRSIVTSQPDIECEVCERRLLRGEQPDLFLDAGQPRMVCELCAPRAAHQGWTRGSEQDVAGPEQLPARRGRKLFGRLRQARRAGALDRESSYELDSYELAAADLDEAQPDDLLDGAREPAARVAPVRAAAAAPAGAAARGVELDDEAVAAPSTDGPLQRAVAVFNAGPFTRRVASLARSLGAPEVTVRPGEAVADCVVIVLAWELCWYAYEIDLDDMQGVEVRARAQGTELSELGPEDRLANALADERGVLALS
jgi:hypothetical protein